jgi:hypothetical protein
MHGEARVVFGSLCGAEHGLRRSGHHRHDTVRAESREALGGVQDAQASATPRAEIDDSTTLRERPDNHVDGPPNLGKNFANRPCHLAVFAVDNA